MGDLVPFAPRLPAPEGVLAHYGLDQSKWRILTDAIFPAAKSVDAICLALDYCRARGLDIMKRPVHIVPMYSSEKGGEVETVWPGINEIEITGARTNAWAGMDSPVFGPDITQTFTGQVKEWEGSGKNRRFNWVSEDLSLTFPEWCEVTVYRMVNGERYPFTERVWWLETYSKTGKGNLPNETWRRRPRSQLQKCAKAASLRAGFPEAADYAAEEMEGKDISEVASDALKGHVIDGTATVVNDGAGKGAKEGSTPAETQTADALFEIVVPTTGEVINVLRRLTPEQRDIQEKLFAELIAGEGGDKVANFSTKLVGRATVTNDWNACIALAHDRAQGNQLVLWYCLHALAKAKAAAIQAERQAQRA